MFGCSCPDGWLPIRFSPRSSHIRAYNFMQIMVAFDCRLLFLFMLELEKKEGRNPKFRFRFHCKRLVKFVNIVLSSIWLFFTLKFNPILFTFRSRLPIESILLEWQSISTKSQRVITNNPNTTHYFLRPTPIWADEAEFKQTIKHKQALVLGKFRGPFGPRVVSVGNINYIDTRCLCFSCWREIRISSFSHEQTCCEQLLIELCTIF